MAVFAEPKDALWINMLPLGVILSANQLGLEWTPERVMLGQAVCVVEALLVLAATWYVQQMVEATKAENEKREIMVQAMSPMGIPDMDEEVSALFL